MKHGKLVALSGLMCIMCVVFTSCNSNTRGSSSAIASSAASSSETNSITESSDTSMATSESATSSMTSTTSASLTDITSLPIVLPSNISKTTSPSIPKTTSSRNNPAPISFVPKNYKLVWNDEFNGNRLDSSKWAQKLDSTQAGDVARLKDDPRVIQVSDGMLKLNTIRYYDPDNPELKYATDYSVQTQDTMNFRYGYLEMRAKIPFKQGAWPALWMKGSGTLAEPKEKSYMVEVDVFENFASTNTLIPHLHKWYYSGVTNQTSDNNPYVFSDNYNLSDEFHTYGFEWTKDVMSMFVDGKKYMTYRLSNNIDVLSSMDGFQDPLYIILNDGIVSPEDSYKPNGLAVDNTKLPYSYYVDWMRLYQIPGAGDIYTKK